MLILTRKIGEEVNIDDHIAIKILRIRGKQIDIGFSAPDSVSIHRHEIYERIKNNDPALAEKFTQKTRTISG